MKDLLTRPEALALLQLAAGVTGMLLGWKLCSYFRRVQEVKQPHAFPADRKPCERIGKDYQICHCGNCMRSGLVIDYVAPPNVPIARKGWFARWRERRKAKKAARRVAKPQPIEGVVYQKRQWTQEGAREHCRRWAIAGCCGMNVGTVEDLRAFAEKHGVAHPAPPPPEPPAPKEGEYVEFGKPAHVFRFYGSGAVERLQPDGEWHKLTPGHAGECWRRFHEGRYRYVGAPPPPEPVLKDGVYDEVGYKWRCRGGRIYFNGSTEPAMRTSPERLAELVALGRIRYVGPLEPEPVEPQEYRRMCLDGSTISFEWGPPPPEPQDPWCDTPQGRAIIDDCQRTTEAIRRAGQPPEPRCTCWDGSGICCASSHSPPPLEPQEGVLYDREAGHTGRGRDWAWWWDARDGWFKTHKRCVGDRGNPCDMAHELFRDGNLTPIDR